MRKAQKKQAEDFIELLSQAHGEIRSAIGEKKYDAAKDLLTQCQEGAIQLADFIEKLEGESAAAISFLGEYCEAVYRIYEGLNENPAADANVSYEELENALLPAANSVKNEIKGKLEIIFFPYKASMWDSLESIWMAADADPDCDAYVIPIPYYERDSQGVFSIYRYEGDEMPEHVPVTPYDSYDLEKRRPDIAYIHNPYDGGNLVTTVDPRYYSGELKKYAELLIYVPYYATSGGMSESQSLCSGYLNADYLVVQSEKHKGYFDPVIPREKLLPFGSPKFDRIVRLCQNPPEPPEAWKADMEGRTVYFYNTSINGMLADTGRFLLKMEYVFRCFEGREDACLLWRPHPLLESSFTSMRKEYQTQYDRLKQYFLENRIGIYDDTPDMGQTIALCDAYIGDAATSVTSLFGIVGKPLFILNNYIHTLPKEDDWRGEIVQGFSYDGYDEWVITQGNKLYHSPSHDYHYEYYCDLSDYASGGYYSRAMEIDGRIIACPRNAQDLLILSDRRIIKRIPLERRMEQPGAFCGACRLGKYLLLIPYRYPAIVRYNTETEKVDYLEGCNEVFTAEVQGEWRIGGACLWDSYLLLASPVSNLVLAVESESMKTTLLTTGTEDDGSGCMGMIAYGEDIYMLPYTGTTVTCWNPAKGTATSYAHMPEGFQCISRPKGELCMEKPFGTAALYDKQLVLSPYWGNMFVSVDIETGTVEEWKPPFEAFSEEKDYYLSWSEGGFIRRTDTLGAGTYSYYHDPERKLYEIRLETKECRETEIVFDVGELRRQEPGFARLSEWLKYGCEEKALYSLKDFLDGTGAGQPFDPEKETEAYREIIANSDGTCGEKVHRFARMKVLDSDEMRRKR